MGTQARPEWDQRLYNINRDLAHNFGFVVRKLAARLEDGEWPFLDQWLKDRAITMDDLGEACKALCIFTQTAAAHPKESMQDALHRSGWWNLKEPAQAATCAMLGTLMMGMFFHGGREATQKKDGQFLPGSPCLSLQDLADCGQQAADLIKMPRWKRKWIKLKARVRKVVEAIRGDDSADENHSIPSGSPTGLQVHAGGLQRVRPAAGSGGEHPPAGPSNQDVPGERS